MFFLIFLVWGWTALGGPTPEMCASTQCKTWQGVMQCRVQQSYRSWSDFFQKNPTCKQTFALICNSPSPFSDGEGFAGCKYNIDALQACATAKNWYGRYLVGQKTANGQQCATLLKQNIFNPSFWQSVDNKSTGTNIQPPVNLTNFFGYMMPLMGKQGNFF